MQARARVRQVDAAADHPAASVLLAIGIAALFVGLSGTWLLAGNLHVQERGSAQTPSQVAASAPGPSEPSLPLEPSVKPEQAVAPAVPNVDAGVQAPMATVDAGGARDATVATEVAVLAPAQPDEQVVDAGTPQRARRSRAQFIAGTVAYLRCDGLKLGRGPFPCPRDRQLERAAWRLLARLPKCELADPGLGTGELRLELAQGAPTKTRFLARGDAAPDVRSVDRCLGVAARELSTSLRSDRMVVAFRFELR